MLNSAVEHLADIFRSRKGLPGAFGRRAQAFELGKEPRLPRQVLDEGSGLSVGRQKQGLGWTSDPVLRYLFQYDGSGAVAQCPLLPKGSKIQRTG